MALLYAITADPGRFRFYLECAVPLVQFRNKNTSAPEFSDLVSESRVIINDSLDEAEKLNAWGVHLGQEDLSCYPKERLLNRQVKLGISTHSDSEIANALTFDPDYIAFGPIFPTTAKPMAFGPQGVARLREVVRSVAVPVVAIGGISLENLSEVLATGVYGVAMISGIAQRSKEEILEISSRCHSFEVDKP